MRIMSLCQLGDDHIDIVRMVPDPHSKGSRPWLSNTASLPVSFAYSYSVAFDYSKTRWLQSRLPFHESRFSQGPIL